MPKRRIQQPPTRTPVGSHAPDLYLLDRFTEKDLETWNARSADLDELHRLLYLGVEPERIRKREALLNALRVKPAAPITFDRWVRMVEHRWTNAPLSSAGSLLGYGGRFNIGQDIEWSLAKPFPALYVADSFETSYRERYQTARDAPTAGLSAEELALSVSTTTVFLRGHIERILDVSDLNALAPICRILAKIKAPAEATRFLKRLRAPQNTIQMIKTALQLQNALQFQNWRGWPVQFGVPSPSQQFGELAQAAGYEAIRYRSTKEPNGTCLAIFSASFGNQASYVELADPYPPEVRHSRLDLDSADELAGWDCLPGSRRR